MIHYFNKQTFNFLYFCCILLKIIAWRLWIFKAYFWEQVTIFVNERIVQCIIKTETMYVQNSKILKNATK